MDYTQLTDIVLTRARRLGLKNPESGIVDASDIELAIYSALLDLVGKYDLDGFVVTNTSMFTTTIGIDEYALPADFSRFVTPREKDRYGIGVWDGSSLSPLVYQRPDEMIRLRPTTNNRPRYYTLTAYGKVKLSPTPDANGTTNYTGRGVYVRDLLPDELESGTVPLGYAMVLEKVALAQLGVDLGHPQAPVLAGEAARAITTTVNGQARQRLEFQNRNTAVGRSASGRY